MNNSSNEWNKTFFSMDCMRGKSIEPASLTWVARVLSLRRELLILILLLMVNNDPSLSCLGRPPPLGTGISEQEVDLRSNVGLGAAPAPARQRMDLDLDLHGWSWTKTGRACRSRLVLAESENMWGRILYFYGIALVSTLNATQPLLPRFSLFQFSDAFFTPFLEMDRETGRLAPSPGVWM